MRVFGVIYALLGSIHTTEDEECTVCFTHEDENEFDYFIYPHEIIEFQDGKCKTNENKQHKIHISCLLEWARKSPRFESSKCTLLDCPTCRQDIAPSLLPALKREILNLRHFEIIKRTINNLKVWRNILINFPNVGRLILREPDKNLKNTVYFLEFICTIYPVDGSGNMHKIFTVLLEYLLEDLEILSIHLVERNDYEAIRGYSYADILAVYYVHYSKMNNYIRSIFDWLTLNFIVRGNGYELTYKGIFNKTMKLVSFEGVLLLWRKVLNRSKKVVHFTNAKMIFDYVQNAFKKSNGRLHFEENLSKISNFSAENDEITTSFKDVAPYDGRFLIPAIICEFNIRQLNKYSHRLRIKTFEKSVLITTIHYLHKNYDKLKSTTPPCELLFIYMGDPWYNAIYYNLSEKNRGLRKQLREISHNFLSYVFRSMQRSEFMACIELIDFMSRDKKWGRFIKSKPKILDVIFEEFLSRTLFDTFLFKYVKVFTQCEYFEYSIVKVKKLFFHIENRPFLNKNEIKQIFFEDVFDKIENTKLLELDKEFLKCMREYGRRIVSKRRLNNHILQNKKRKMG